MLEVLIIVVIVAGAMVWAICSLHRAWAGQKNGCPYRGTCLRLGHGLCEGECHPPSPEKGEGKGFPAS